MRTIEKPTSPVHCQIACLPGVAQPIGRMERLWQFRNRLKRFLKRRLLYLRNAYSRDDRFQESIFNDATNTGISTGLQPGDTVRIRPRNTIEATLSPWNQLKGCAFLEEMRSYCDSEHTVLKRVEQFLDERDYLVKRSPGLIILDGIICEGTKDFGRCDRSCFYFWREEWLEKIK